MSRYVILGAGAVGCLIGSQLHLAGVETVLVARGEHGAELSRRGLRFRAPDGEQLLRVAVFEDIALVDLTPGDVVILSVKTQDSWQAMTKLAALTPPGTAVVCAQNGLESERMALRLFESVYGASVFVLASMTEAGIVSCFTAPCRGIIDFGRYPGSADPLGEALAADFRRAGFDSLCVPDVMAAKRGKLLISLNNAISALVRPGDKMPDIVAEVRAEAERCFRAAGLTYVATKDLRDREKLSLTSGVIDGRAFSGGSAAQTLLRGAASSEADFVNGEIVLLGRQFGIPTPLNGLFQDLMRAAVTNGAGPGHVTAARLRQEIARRGQSG